MSAIRYRCCIVKISAYVQYVSRISCPRTSCQVPAMLLEPDSHACEIDLGPLTEVCAFLSPNLY